MKRILIYSFVLFIFGCSEDTGMLNAERQTITVNATLNETSSPHAGTSNTIIYQTYSNVDIPQDPRIENIVIHSITVKVLNYSCSRPEMYGHLHTQYNISNGISIDSWMFLAKENFSGKVPYQEFLNGMAKQLKSYGTTDIGFQTSLPADISDFEVELAIDIDLSIQYKIIL